MKNKFFLLLLAISFCSLVFSQAPSKPLKIQLKIKGFSNGVVKLFGIHGEKNYFVDSAFVDAWGQAVLEKDSSLPGGMYFVLFSDLSLVQLLIDKEQQFSIEFDKRNIVNSLKVNGSLDNELLYKNLRFEAGNSKKTDSLQQLFNNTEKTSAAYRNLESEIQKLKDERKVHIKWFSDNYPDNFFTRFKLSGQNPEISKPLLPDGTVDDLLYVYNFRIHYWDGYDFSDERLLRTPVYANKLKKYMLDVTPQIIDSIIKYSDWVVMQSKSNREIFRHTANWIALHYKEAKLMGRESVYVFMVEKFWTPEQAFWLKDYEVEKLRMQARQMKVSLLGKTGHNISGISESNQTVSLYDITTPIKVVYVFSYDCENCKKETPKLIKVYNEWKDKGLDIFSICIDGDRDKWKSYLQQNKMTFRNIFDPNNETNFRAHYWFEATPGMFVLDKDNRIIAYNIGSESLEIIMKKKIEK